jgi:hypothetical protein
LISWYLGVKINYVRKQSGKEQQSFCLILYVSLLTRPRVGERCSKEALCELLEQLDDPEAGITFQSQVEHVLLGDIRAYQNRLLASNDELKCRVIDWITSTGACMW